MRVSVLFIIGVVVAVPAFGKMAPRPALPEGWQGQITPGFDPAIESKLVECTETHDPVQDATSLVCLMQQWGPGATAVLIRLYTTPGWEQVQGGMWKLMAAAPNDEARQFFTERVRELCTSAQSMFYSREFFIMYGVPTLKSLLTDEAAEILATGLARLDAQEGDMTDEARFFAGFLGVLDHPALIDALREKTVNGRESLRRWYAAGLGVNHPGLALELVRKAYEETKDDKVKMDLADFIDVDCGRLRAREPIGLLAKKGTLPTPVETEYSAARMNRLLKRKDKLPKDPLSLFMAWSMACTEGDLVGDVFPMPDKSMKRKLARVAVKKLRGMKSEYVVAEAGDTAHAAGMLVLAPVAPILKDMVLKTRTESSGVMPCDYECVINVLWAYGRTAGKDGISFIVGLISDEYAGPAFREGALAALGRLGTPEALEVLDRLYDDAARKGNVAPLGPDPTYGEVMYRTVQLSAILVGGNPSRFRSASSNTLSGSVSQDYTSGSFYTGQSRIASEFFFTRHGDKWYISGRADRLQPIP